MPHAVLTVGVTGHRSLADADEVQRRVTTLVDDLVLEGSARASSMRLEVLSCLAEGADRIVAEDVLARPRASLVAVLPVPADDYRQDFLTTASKTAFDVLLQQAARVVTMPRMNSRTEAYLAASRYVVDHVDVLIALWNGEDTGGPGGTADTVAYASARNGRPVVHVVPVLVTASR